jgi:hypothetical protein
MHKCRIALLALLMTGVLLAFSGASAQALNLPFDPLTHGTCWVTTCHSSGGSLVSGGDGTSVKNFITGTGLDGPTATSMDSTYTKVLTDTEVLPALETVPAFTTITLGVAAFAVGWKIGSTLNSKWLHIAGVGLGRQDTLMTQAITGDWAFCAEMSTCSGFIGSGASGPGWKLELSANGGGLSSNYDSNPAVSLALQAKAAWVATYASGSGTDITLGSDGFGGNLHVRYIPYAVMASRLNVDQPLQPFVAQTPVTISTAWPVKGGAGTCTSPGIGCTAAGAFPGSQTDPQICLYTTTLTCGDPGVTGLTNVTLSPQPLTADPDGTDPSQNALRCATDPADFTCPVSNGSGGWTSNGGLKTADWTVTNCLGLTVTACETGINTASTNGNWAAPAYTIITAPTPSANPDYGPGAVITQTPPGSTVETTRVTTVTLTINPDPLPLVILQPRPWETTTQYIQRMTNAGIPTSVATALLGNTPNTIGPNEVISTTPVPGTLVDPTVTTVTVTEGNPSAPYPPGDPNNPAVVTGPGGCNCGQIEFPNVALGTAFPFGIFVWLNGIYDGFTEASSCPTVAIHKPGVLGGGDQDLVLCSTDWETTYRPIVFPILEFLMTLAAIWFLAFKVIGLGGGDD